MQKTAKAVFCCPHARLFFEYCIINAMTDFQPQPGQNWSEKNPVIGTGEGEVPLANAPMTNINMRTMASDVASIKETGGGEPKPYNPQGQAFTPSAAPAPIVPPQADFGNAMPSMAAAAMPAVKKGTNWFAIIASFIALLGVLALAYFFIYPRFFAPATPAAPVTQTNEPATSAPLPSTPAATTSLPVSTTTTSTLSVAESQFQTVILHSSLFKKSADAVSEVTPTAMTSDAIKTAITSNPVQVPMLKEIVFKNSIGKVYAASSILPLFTPAVFTASTTAYFEPDMSFFTYVDQTGAWPGVVLKLASGAKLADAKTAIKGLETDNEITSLFLSDPGNIGSWKDGKVSTFIARYVPFSVKGNAFSYAWLNNYLVISTNYAGAQSAAAKLGL